MNTLTPTLFYSWQSDLPERNNHRFIGECLQVAKENLELEEPLRVESGAVGEPGTPNIVRTIFERLERAEVAVFDVTPIATTNAGKNIPNPNVLVELGFAWHAIEWQRIICVMNGAYGHQPKELPFDIQNRFPLCYNYAGDSRAPSDVRDGFTKALVKAVQDCLKHEHSVVQRVLRQMNHNCLKIIYDHGRQESFASIDETVPPGVDRLLELGVLWCDSNPPESLYGYHWTYLGERICESFLKDVQTANTDPQADLKAPPSASLK